MANYLAPSRAELNAGTNLTPEVASSGNWAITSNAIDTPDLATLYTSQISGKITTDGSTLNMYSDDNQADARSLMPRGSVGFVVKFPGGMARKHCDRSPGSTRAALWADLAFGLAPRRVLQFQYHEGGTSLP
jgi:hypothetical protein